MLQGDRFFALLMVRALTYGPEYAFGVSCRNDNCRAPIEWEIDLTKLPVRKLSEQSRAAFVDGNRFATALPDAGKRARVESRVRFSKPKTSSWCVGVLGDHRVDEPAS